MIHKEIRQRFEHKEIPYRFFVEKGSFIERIQKEGELYRILDDLYADEETENPYAEEEFRVQKRRVTDSISLVTLSFPEPVEATDCVRIHLVYDTAFKNCSYYTVEKGMEEHWMGSWEAEVRFMYRPIEDFIADDVGDEISRALYNFGTEYPDYAEEIEEAREVFL